MARWIRQPPSKDRNQIGLRKSLNWTMCEKSNSTLLSRPGQHRSSVPSDKWLPLGWEQSNSNGEHENVKRAISCANRDNVPTLGEVFPLTTGNDRWRCVGGKLGRRALTAAAGEWDLCGFEWSEGRVTGEEQGDGTNRWNMFAFVDGTVQFVQQIDKFSESSYLVVLGERVDKGQQGNEILN